MQIFEGRICPPPEGYITIAVSKFNKTITQRLLDGALAKLRQHRVHEKDIRIVWVPGTYELPFVASYFSKDPKCLAIICLGAVIKGETSHDQHINRSVSMAFGEIAARSGTPVIFGVLTCDTVEQANARSGIIESVKDKVLNPAPGNKGAEAAEAALEMIDLLTELPEITPPNPIPEILSKLFIASSDNDDDDDNDDDNYDYEYDDDDNDDDNDDNGNDDNDDDSDDKKDFYFSQQKFDLKNKKKKKKN